MMRTFNMAVLVAAVAIFGSSGVASAAPKDYCADLKGGNTGTTCEIQLSDPAWFNTESDLGPGPATDPGRSLRWAKVSAAYMLQLREGEREDCDDHHHGRLARRA